MALKWPGMALKTAGSGSASSNSAFPGYAATRAAAPRSCTCSRAEPGGNVLVMTSDQTGTAPFGGLPDASLSDAVRQVLPSARADLERLVRIPSVSADPDAAPHLWASAW